MGFPCLPYSHSVIHQACWFSSMVLNPSPCLCLYFLLPLYWPHHPSVGSLGNLLTKFPVPFLTMHWICFQLQIAENSNKSILAIKNIISQQEIWKHLERWLAWPHNNIIKDSGSTLSTSSGHGLDCSHSPSLLISPDFSFGTLTQGCKPVNTWPWLS